MPPFPTTSPTASPPSCEALGNGAPTIRYVDALHLADLARLLGLSLDLAAASARFGALLCRRLEGLTAAGDAAGWRDFLELLQVGARLGLRLPERPLQDRLFGFLESRVPALLDGLRDVREPAYALVTAVLAAASRLNLRTDELRQRLKPLEEPFAGDPAYWP